MKIPRILITAPRSGSGKTLITCGILELIKHSGRKTSAFKCGPDYIDPMFHHHVQDVPGGNLDSFLMGEAGVRYSFAKHGRNSIAVLEGVMGYYDGLSGRTTAASSYDIACITGTPVILILDARGTYLSAAAAVKGFADFRNDSRISGVILNHISSHVFDGLKELIERETNIPVIGYVPELKDCTLESRHLGLVLPEEVAGLKETLAALRDTLAGTIDMKRLMAIADGAPEIPESWLDIPFAGIAAGTERRGKRIGLARDEAFCFFYRDNLELFEEAGASLIPFSPVHDRALPDNLDGLLLYGGYPEIYAEALSENTAMREAVRRSVLGGMPCIAECGGFLYLLEALEDMNGHSWPMAGVLTGRGFRTPRLTRFGYVNLEGGTVFGKDTGGMRGHEFHYFDAENCGSAFQAVKPESGRSWPCMYSTDTLLAGFPHIHYYSRPEIVEQFLNCSAH